MQNGTQSSTALCSPADITPVAFEHSSVNLHALFERISSFFHQSQSNTDAATELQQRLNRSVFFVVLVLSKLPQDKTESHWLLLHSRYDTHGLLALLHQVQHLPSHDTVGSYHSFSLLCISSTHTSTAAATKPSAWASSGPSVFFAY